MRQRLGRSGRRPGQAAIMRVYVTEAELTGSSHPLDALLGLEPKNSRNPFMSCRIQVGTDRLLIKEE